MRTIHFQELEQTLAKPVTLDLTLNDLRILVTSLNALAYLSEAHNENYLDPEGLELRDRLEADYQALMQRKTISRGA